MKVYVSGQVSDIESVQQVQKRLVDAGHEVTHDWTLGELGDTRIETREDKLQNKVEAGRRAQKDIEGAVDADVVVVCTDNQVRGAGMYVELGAALAQKRLTGKPSIFTIGSRNHLSIFYLHPDVQHVDSIEELIINMSL